MIKACAFLIGANIFFADVDKNTGQMTPKLLEECIKKNKIKKLKAFCTMYHGGSPRYAKEFFKEWLFSNLIYNTLNP